MPAPGGRGTKGNRPHAGGGGTRPQPANTGGSKGKGGGPKPKIPSMKDWLASDQIYNTATDQIGSAWNAFKNQQDVALGRAQGDLSDTLSQMRTQKNQDLRDIKGDYAARGLGNSGVLFNQIENEYKPAWEKQKGLAQQAFSRVAGGEYEGKGKKRHYVFDPSSDLGMQLANQDLIRRQQKKNAWYEAYIRKMQKFGLTNYGA